MLIKKNSNLGSYITHKNHETTMKKQEEEEEEEEKKEDTNRPF
jgi:hypothetical protein